MMTVLMMKMLLVLFFTKYVICAKGFVDEILLNRRFYCPLSFSETSTVTSEIQCTQRCLRKECKLLNYNKKQGKKDNCEIYAHTNECSTLINQDNWKAVSFQQGEPRPDVDECKLAVHNCHINASCSNTPASFSCSCNNGYTGDGIACSDIDECSLRIHNCNINSTCTNKNGSFTCQCLPGYYGDGMQCIENIAYARESSQSSLHSVYGIDLIASYGNDGNRDGNWEVCAWTRNLPIPAWWRVDLGRIAAVKYIIIRSGSTFGQMKINPFFISVGNDGSNGGTNNPLCVNEGRVNAGEIKTFYCSTTMQGRYVTVFINRMELLQICELEVYE